MVDESILDEAHRLVHGPRQESYGHPLDDFTRTGRVWGAILGIPDVPAEKVALCLVGVKLSREVNAHKRDNLVDLAGYAETAALVIEERERGAGWTCPQCHGTFPPANVHPCPNGIGGPRCGPPGSCVLTPGHDGDHVPYSYLDGAAV